MPKTCRNLPPQCSDEDDSAARHSDTSPNTLPKFRKWLDNAIEELAQYCEYGDPDFFNELAIAQVVRDAQRLAGRFGFGEASEEEYVALKAEDGLAILGRIHVALQGRMKRPSDFTARFLAIDHAAIYAGVSPGSIRAMISAGKLTALRPVKGRTVIDRHQIDSVIVASNSRPRKGRGVRT